MTRKVFNNNTVKARVVSIIIFLKVIGLRKAFSINCTENGNDMLIDMLCKEFKILHEGVHNNYAVVMYRATASLVSSKCKLRSFRVLF